MSFFSHLRIRTSTRSPRGRPQHRPAAARCRPHLEALEGRDVPSTLKVTNLADSGSGSLRYEIAQAKSGDTIVFAKSLDGGTITLYSGELYIQGRNLTIQGPGAGLLTVASDDPYSPSRIFEVGNGATVALSALTISHGSGGASVFNRNYFGYGGAVLNFGQMTISGCTLEYNSTSYGGGAIYNANTMTVSGCTLTDNFSYGDGGGIDNAGALTVSACTLTSDNTASNVGHLGGGIYNDYTGTLTVSGTTLSNDFASDGGGIYNVGTATVSGCTVSGDSAYEGGGIYNAGTLTVLNSVFSSNSPDNIYGPYTDDGGNTFS